MTTYDNWKTTDPNLEGGECPQCDGPVEGDRYEGRCVNEAHLLTEYDEPCPHTQEERDECVCDCRPGCGWGYGL